MYIDVDDIRKACAFVDSYSDDVHGYCEIVLDLSSGSVTPVHHNSLFDVPVYDPDKYLVQRGFAPHGRKAVPGEVLARFHYSLSLRNR